MKNIRLTTDEKIELAIEHVHGLLQSREINPAGKSDEAGRFWIKNHQLVNVRNPSRSYPFSQLVAGRTKKYVRAVYEETKPKTLNALMKLI